MELRIEKGVPIPSKSKVAIRMPTLRAMKPGDSVVEPLNGVLPTALQMRWHSAAKHCGVRITTRVLDDRSGLRVWLVATSRRKARG